MENIRLDNFKSIFLQVFHKELIIAREWKRCDLAILDKETLKPIVLIEFKACYSFDLSFACKYSSPLGLDIPCVW